MKAAYGTFLEALLMIKCHDMVADQAAAQYNVTWSRTTPIIVSVFDDAYRTVLTLECSHRFGMDVTGDPGNILAFRYACSSAVNPIEHMVGESLFPGGNGTSIVMGLGQMILNGEQVDMFWSNGYLVMKSAEDGLFLVLDPETGVVRDIMQNGLQFFNSAYCFSDQQTEWAGDLAEKLNSTNLNMNSTFPFVIGSTIMGVVENAPAILRALLLEGVPIEFAGVFIAPAMLDAMVLAVIEKARPELVADAEQNGLFNLADYLRNNNALDLQWDAMLQLLGMGSGPPQGVWDESYGYSNLNMQRNLEDIKNLKEGALATWGEICGVLWGSDNWSVEINLSPASEWPEGGTIKVNWDKDPDMVPGDDDPSRFKKFVIVAAIASLITALPAKFILDYGFSDKNDTQVNVTNENGTMVINITSNRTIITRMILNKS